MSKEKKELQALWRTAANRTEPLLIQYADAPSAKKGRFAIYNAVRAVRKDPMLDQGLAEAVENVALSFDDERTLRMEQRSKDDGPVRMALRAAGVDPDALKSQEELAIEESTKRLMERLEAPEGPPMHNPYGTARNRG